MSNPLPKPPKLPLGVPMEWRQWLEELWEKLKSFAESITTLESPTAPTVQKFTVAGSGTYTKPAACRWIRVRMVGAGGGGGSGGTSAAAGSNGGNTIFGTSLLEANGGTGGFVSGGAPGGTASLGTGPLGIAMTGSYGDSGSVNTITGASGSGGSGGNSPFGGAGRGGPPAGNGAAAAANSGSGGGGGGQTTTSAAAGGGGAGGFVDAIITDPDDTYDYTVGAKGAGNTAGAFDGGDGADGMIIVEEHYQ